MKTGVVVGRVVSSTCIEQLERKPLLVVQPVDSSGSRVGRTLVAVDTVSAGEGDVVMFEGGKEAAQALSGWFNPVDAAIIGIIDRTVAERRS